MRLTWKSTGSMFRASAAWLLLLTLCHAAALPARAQVPSAERPGDAKTLVMFIPRHEPFWDTNVRYAQAAARDLGINLKVVDFQDDPAVELAGVERVCREGAGGIIFQAFADTGEAVLQITEKYRVPAFMINTGIEKGDFPPRTKYQYWVGKMTPDDVGSGTMIIQQLLGLARKAGVSEYHILGIEGRPNQEASILRRKGLEHYIKYSRDVKSLTLVPGNWDPAAAAALFKKHYTENPGINIVWCANDNMALAVADAVEELGIKSPVFIGSADWDPRALQAIGRGRMHVSVGGHFIEGAWAVLLMHDYLKGRDFATEGLVFATPMQAVTQNNLATIDNFLSLGPDEMDFRDYSKVYNSMRGEYGLDLSKVAEEIYRAKTQPSEGIELTGEEVAWIKAHPKITVAVMNSWPPLNMADARGKAEGIGVDYLKLLGKHLGMRFDILTGPFMDNLEAVRQKRIDALMDVTPKPDREEYLHFTRPYLSVPHVIVARSDGPFHENEDHLSGKTLALEQKFGNVNHFRENYPAVKIAEYPGTEDCLQAVSRGAADAYAGNQAVATYIISQKILTNLQVQGNLRKAESVLTIGVRKDWPQLASLLDKALATVTVIERQAIHRNWSYRQEEELVLNDEEKAWLRSHVDLRVGITQDLPPYEFVDKEGRPAGIVSEYLKWLNKTLGVNLNPRVGLTWAEILDAARGNEIDVIPSIVRTKEREELLRFTRPYLRIPLVIITRDDAAYVDGLNSLADRVVALTRGYNIQSLIERRYPEVKLLPVDTPEAALRAVAEGRAEATLENVAVLTYLAGTLGIRNLKVAAPTAYTDDLSFGVRKDMPELAVILDKALASIPEKDKAVFQERWVNIRVEHQVDWTMVLRIVLAIALVAATILTLIIRSNRKLAREVRERTLAEQKMQAMSSAIHDALIMTDARARVMYWNHAAETLFGITADEVMGKDMHGLFAPEDYRDRANVGMETFAKTGRGPVVGRLLEMTALRTDGTRFPAEVGVSAFHVGDTWHAVGTVRDITERKRSEEALLKQERQLRVIIDNIPAVIILKDSDGRHLMVNTSYEEAMGLPPEKVLGRTDADILPPEMARSIMAVEREIMDLGEQRTFEEQVHHPDGTMHSYLTTKVPLRDDSNNTYALVVLATDITERKKAEQEMQQHLDELEGFNRLVVGREERMIQLKEEINRLLTELGRPPKYEIVE